MSGRARSAASALAQILGSALVIGLLARDAEPERVLAALSGASLPWVLASASIKALGVTLHEVRIWVALLPWRRAELARVIGIGYTAGLLNGILPIRGGDLVAVGLLRAECGASATEALAAVAITAFGEALVFALFCLGVLGLGLSQWEQILGPAGTARALTGLTLLTVGSLFGAALLVILARRLKRAEARPGVREWLRQAVTDAGTGLSSTRPLLLNFGLALLQLFPVVASFWALFPALSLSPPMPVLASCGVIAIGAVAGVVLPPGLGASQAATSVFVLSFFGVDEPSALAYAALGWVTNTGPAFVLGIVPFLRRLRRLPNR